MLQPVPRAGVPVKCYFTGVTANNPRVRFAPSPTGHLHLGGARTALFNWLFARSHGGTLVLRIEDTDVERSSREMVEGILEGLRWLGLNWDEGPYFQSQRLELYRQRAQQLLDSGWAYRDFDSGGGEPDAYRRFRSFSEDEVQALLDKSAPFAVRFRVPEGEQVTFFDQVYGNVEVASEQLEDFVLLRSDGTPTYHLCVVADDLDMRITHVIRGVDHLSNTGKQLLIYLALEAAPPEFAHLPLILGPDRQRLSKRHGATSVTEFRKTGFLDAALRNYLALLGWSPGDDREIMSDRELISLFSLKGVNRSDAVFDLQKLTWMNGQYLRSLTPAELADQLVPFLESAGLWREEWAGRERSWFLSLVKLFQPRIQLLTEFSVAAQPFMREEVAMDSESIERFRAGLDATLRERLQPALKELQEKLAALETYSPESLEPLVRDIASTYELKLGQLIGAVRLGLTGKSASPGIFDVMILLGRDQTLRRLKSGLSILE